MSVARRTFGAALVLLSTGGFGDASEMRRVFTETAGPSCRDASRRSLGSWVCEGPRDFVVTFTDEGNLVGLTFGRTGGDYDNVRSGLVWRGSRRSFGDKMAWLVDPAGRPVASVLRTWRTDDQGRVDQSLKVFALNENRACLFASISTDTTGADAKAAVTAVHAARWRCAETEKVSGE